MIVESIILSNDDRHEINATVEINRDDINQLWSCIDFYLQNHVEQRKRHHDNSNWYINMESIKDKFSAILKVDQVNG